MSASGAWRLAFLEGGVLLASCLSWQQKLNYPDKVCCTLKSSSKARQGHNFQVEVLRPHGSGRTSTVSTVTGVSFASSAL